jgi:broad specificity phosphatase PhoE
MHVVIVRHGESHYNLGTTQNLDSQLTETGMKQSCITIDWLLKNIDLFDYKAMTSPYLRCLQTSSVLAEMSDIPVVVNDNLRELHLSLKKADIIGGGLNIPNRAVSFPNLLWNEWKVDFKFFSNEKVPQFVDRMASFVGTLSGNIIMVTHAVAHRTISDLLTGKSPEELKERWKDSKIFLEDTAIHNCGITMVVNGELLGFNKVAWSKVI